MENSFGHFFSYYRVWQTSSNFLLGSRRYSSNDCAVYKIISITTQRWFRTQIFERNASWKFSLVGKEFWSPYSRNVEFEKRRGTIYKGAQGNLIFTVQLYDPFFRAKRLLESKIFEKKAIFPKEIKFSPNFSGFIENEKRHGTIYKGPRRVLIVFVQDITSFL